MKKLLIRSWPVHVQDSKERPFFPVLQGIPPLQTIPKWSYPGSSSSAAVNIKIQQPAGFAADMKISVCIRFIYKFTMNFVFSFRHIVCKFKIINVTASFTCQ